MHVSTFTTALNEGPTIVLGEGQINPYEKAIVHMKLIVRVELYWQSNGKMQIPDNL